jgi:ATP-binding cassette, subfamily B, multidrug efflux pump
VKLLIKYLKPFVFTIGLVIALLFLQARMDLSLPNYMSNIINVGIQQNGIEDVAPKAISENGFLLMTSFMADPKEVLDSYTLVNKGDSLYIKDYPLLETSNIYILKDNKNVDIEFAKSASAILQFGKQEMNSGPGNFTDIYKILPMINNLKPQIDKIISEDKTPSAMQSQIATSLTKNFYVELGVDISKLQNDYIINQGLIMLVIALIGGMASITVGYFGSKMAAKVAMKMRHDVFEKVMSYTSHEVNKFGSSSLITRTTNDVSQVQQLIFMGIRMIAYAPIIGVGGVLMALEKSSSMSWIIALAVTMLLVIIGLVFMVAVPKFKLFQTLVDKLNLVARENLNGLLVIRAFGTEKFEQKRFETANKNLADTNLFIGKIMSLLFPLVNLIMSATIILIVWVSAHQIADSTMQIGDMMAFMQYTMQIIMSFIMITITFIMIPRASVSLKRISEVLNTDPLIKDPDNEISFDESKKGVLEFNNVSFRYSDAEEDVLHDITFKALPNKITAFIGSTGSGKSTLINLIPRFYDVTNGSILVNGVDIRSVNTKVLRDVIGYIPQKGVLLSGTVLSNINFGKEDASIEEINEAIRVSQSDFVNDLDNKLDYQISQGGSNVSGGQKQRLSIARALVKKPDIYIFDDSFSALDFKTDAKLRKELKQYTKDATVLIVAQRISTIMHADQIIVLDQGKVVGIGSHEELIKSCNTYFEIASSQLSKEELA